MSTTEALIANYGLFAVFLGGLLEGETILVLAAVAAHHGILPLPGVFLVAACAAMLGDLAWFMLARYKSDHRLVQRFMTRPVLQRAMDRVHRHPRVFVLSFRFIYGLRIAGALACGLSHIPTAQFIALNLVAALIWTAAILSLGYYFGSAIEAVFGEVHRVEWKLIPAIAIVIGIYLFSHKLLKRNRHGLRWRSPDR